MKRKYWRRSAALGLIGALALLAAACGDETLQPAAVVGDTRIEQEDVIEELDVISGNQAYLELMQGFVGAQAQGSVAGTYDAAFVAQLLALRINLAVIGNEVDRRGLESDEQCTAAARRDVETQLGNGNAQQGAELLSSFPAEFQEALVDRFGDVLLLQADLAGVPCVADDAAADYYERHREDFEQACLSVIGVTDPAVAEAVAAQLAGGADFAAVASQYPDSPSAATGGDVGCRARNQLPAALVDPVFDATAGQIVGPVSDPQAGVTYVVRVNERRSPSLEEVREQAAELAALEVNETFGQWLAQALLETEVEVDPRYGTWNPVTGRIDPPSIDTATTTSSTLVP